MSLRGCGPLLPSRDLHGLYYFSWMLCCAAVTRLTHCLHAVPASDCICVQSKPEDDMNKKAPPRLDFSLSRYGHAYHLSERIGFYFEDLAGTMRLDDAGMGRAPLDGQPAQATASTSSLTPHPLQPHIAIIKLAVG